jgi:malonyl-CoA decarboxylase
MKNKKETLTHVKLLDKAIQEWLTQALSLDCIKHERITFDYSSGLTLEKVARGESVHRVRSLSELKRRLHDGKRCYGFFHPSMPIDPLVFVHVALTSELCPSLSALDTFKEEEKPGYAMFYSINSPHVALRGLDIASLLIKETTEALQQTRPSLHTFSTLSPMPSFSTYLSQVL